MSSCRATNAKAAGPRRNQLIVARCTDVIAFWDGKSPGTLDTIRKAMKAGKSCAVYPLPKGA